MADVTEPSDRAAFLEEPAQYERRAIAFYDVLGWRSKIEAAGNDVQGITTLKNIVRMFSASNNAYASKNPFAVRQSTFSDNVVVSTEASQHSIFTLMVRLALTQFVAAQFGFYLRGGVTIGEVVHDDHVVFGPGLNRAYQLECTIADKPKIILDPMCFETFGGAAQLGTLVAVEDNIYFLNPWTVEFAGLHSMIPGEQKGRVIPPLDALAIVLHRVLVELQGRLDNKTIVRLTWLRDRLGSLFLKDGKPFV